MVYQPPPPPPPPDEPEPPAPELNPGTSDDYEIAHKSGATAITKMAMRVGEGV